MKIRSLLYIAVKAIMGKKMRSLLTIGGVMVGIGSIVFLVSLGYGVQQLIVEKVTGLDALRIIDVSTVKSKIIKLDQETITRLSSLDTVDKVEPLINTPGQISFKGSATDVVVFGANPEYLDMAAIDADIGETLSASGDEVLVNTAVLRLVGVEEKDYKETPGQMSDLQIILLAEQLSEGETEGVSKTVDKKLRITGVIDDNETPYVFLPLSILQEEGIKNYSQAKVRVEGKGHLDEVRQKIEVLGLSTTSAADTVEQIDQIFSLFRVVLGSFGSIALVVAALGMFNTLTVSLMERTREVGLMKALGAKKKDVFSLFLSEALVISCVGGTLGVIFGMGLGEAANYGLSRLAEATGNQLVDVFHTPYIFVLAIIIFSFVVGFMTGIYPSRRASRLNPLDALRYE